MKKLVNKVKNAVSKIKRKVAKIEEKVISFLVREVIDCKNIILYLKTNGAEGYVDTGVKVLIAVVVGALFLTLLYALVNTTIMPSVSGKITELFSYAG